MYHDREKITWSVRAAGEHGSSEARLRPERAHKNIVMVSQDEPQQWQPSTDTERVGQHRKHEAAGPAKKAMRPVPPAARLIQGDFVPREKTGRNRRRHHTGNATHGTEERSTVPATTREHRQRQRNGQVNHSNPKHNPQLLVLDRGITAVLGPGPTHCVCVRVTHSLTREPCCETLPRRTIPARSPAPPAGTASMAYRPPEVPGAVRGWYGSDPSK